MELNQNLFSKLARLANFARLASVYVRHNFKSQWEYRSAFCSQVLSMLINDCFWLVFWVLFFRKFPVAGSWNQSDIVTLWAVSAAGFGVAHGIAGNSGLIATVILKGQLDTWLLYPRAVLPHLLFGKMSVASWGDVIFGVCAYVLLVYPSFGDFMLFLLMVISTAIVFVGYGVLVGSLGFFVGSAEGLAEQLRFALVTFSTYPPSIFDGFARLVLYTIIPAAFCGFLPVEALRCCSFELGLLSLAGSLVVLAVGSGFFYYGLRRYESGNLMEMRG